MKSVLVVTFGTKNVYSVGTDSTDVTLEVLYSTSEYETPEDIEAFKLKCQTIFQEKYPDYELSSKQDVFVANGEFPVMTRY
jgi:hypothetical protein